MLKKQGILAALAVALVIGFAVAGSTRTTQANHGPFPDEMTIFTNLDGVNPQGTCTVAAVPSCTVLNPGPGAGDGDGDQGNVAPSIGGVPVGFTFKAIISVNQQAAAYDGYTYEVAFLDAILGYVSQTDLDTTLESCAAPGTVLLAPLRIVGLGSGCISTNGAELFVNPVEEITLMCNAAGLSLIALISLGEDPTFGSSFILPGGAVIPGVMENQLPNPLPPPTTVAANVVACLQPIDVSVAKAAPANANVGDAGNYAITISNTGPGTVNVDMSDAAPIGTTFTSIDNAPFCVFAAAVANCTALPIPAAGAVVVNIGVTFDTCGNKVNPVAVQVSSGQTVIDVNPANNSSSAATNVDCPVISLIKSVDPVKGIAGVTVFNYQTLVCNDGGVIAPGSTANNINVSDPIKGPNIVNIAVLGGGQCVPINDGIIWPVPGQVCNFSSATSDDAGNPVSNTVCVDVNPNFPDFNGMRKDCFNPIKESVPDNDTDTTCNVFLFKLADKTPVGILGIAEQLNIPPDVDTCNDDDDPAEDDNPNIAGNQDYPCAGDPAAPLLPWQDNQDLCGLLATITKGQPVYPKHYIPGQTRVDCNDGEVPEGLGAIEFQIKYDHKLFQQPILSGCTFSPNRLMQPVVSVITENWTLFGCVTKDDPLTPGKDLGDIDPASIVATIFFNVQTDLFQRIRPTKDNGVVTDLLDENCEAADIHGEPWPGSVQGGLLVDCGDATITIRMLEGDVDLDCDVDVADDQAEAYRYGSTFGNLLYNRFFDLEPSISPDFDIDIKDLQTVFGRNGSTCNVPQPDQLPNVMVPDP